MVASWSVQPPPIPPGIARICPDFELPTSSLGADNGRSDYTGYAGFFSRKGTELPDNAKVKKRSDLRSHHALRLLLRTVSSSITRFAIAR
jgi:hypothetical protein